MKIENDNNHVTVEMSSDDVVAFAAFRKHQMLMDKIPAAWGQVIEYSKQMGNGSFSIVVQNGVPVRIDRPMQKVIIGLKL